MERMMHSVLETPVQGQNLRPGTLLDQLAPDRPTFVVFLRHFG